ncbi:MAG: glutamine--fructose-6-phosphate aminotransferase [Elusimicrobia bacterium RIFOXYB2_FULL_49_7]|nr:MAG: glutamine--fructose-6-phosphate aminotransferase [Elusimicrobia bacterium RIFOXYB2_FULL_49_7]
MCGIVGYIGKKAALPIVINGISRLDYRGYDSVGITLLEENKLSTFKAKGKIDNLQKKLDQKTSKASVGIGHTRWATHGKPSVKNAHPHLSQNREIAIVHNGIIENHQTLRAFLTGKGYVFRSETDTESVAHLVEYCYHGNLEEAVVSALKEIQGTYGLCILSAKERELIVARRGSPIIIGIIHTGEYIVASDLTAISEHTNNIIYLSDNDVAVLNETGYRIFNLKEEKISRKVEKISWSLSAIEKGSFKHFMHKEIFEQPDALKRLLAGKYDAKNSIPKFGGINIKELDLKNIQRVIILACGTSWHAGLVGEYYLEKYAGLQVEVEYASEFLCKAEQLSYRDLVIAISQSGETMDTLLALRKAVSQSALSLGLINSVGSTIAREVDGGLYLHVGPEIGVASTKAFTGQVLSLFLLSLYLGRVRGCLKAAECDALFKQARALPLLLKGQLKGERAIIAIARRFKRAPNFIFLGRGIHFPTALEGALKLKELSYIHAEGYPAGEMKHGPIALVDKKMPVVFVVKKDDGHSKILSNIEEIRARKGIILSLIEENDKDVRKKSDYVIKVPSTIPDLSPIVYILPLQLLAYHIARLRGCEIDKPRNLAKAVTVQ